MNPGKRYIRNTVLVLWGTVVVFVGMNRLNAAIGPDAPRWLSLGLHEDHESHSPPEVDLGSAKDFTKVSIHGQFHVEIIGADHYKVTFTSAAGQNTRLHAMEGDGYLHVYAKEEEGGGAGGTLRIEVPTLSRIDANVPELAVSGLQAPELYLMGFGTLARVRLQQNHVEHWRMFSGSTLDVRMDDATFAAGSVKANGDVVIRRDQ